MSELKKVGKRRKYMDLEFWSENGLIYMEDHRDGSFQVLTRFEAFERAQQMAEEAPRMKYYDEQIALLKMVEQMCDVVQEAKDQGDPMDDEVRKQKGREIKRSRSSILLPSGEIPGAKDSLINSPLEIYKKFNKKP